MNPTAAMKNLSAIKMRFILWYQIGLECKGLTHMKNISYNNMSSLV